MRKLLVLAAAAAVIAAFAALTPSVGADPGARSAAYPPNKTIATGDDFFRPGYLAGTKSIPKNTLVRFNWTGENVHNVTPSAVPRGVRKADFTSRAFLQGSGVKFQRRFRTPGTYKFYCSFHLPNMKITINVKR